MFANEGVYGQLHSVSGASTLLLFRRAHLGAECHRWPQPARTQQAGQYVDKTDGVRVQHLETQTHTEWPYVVERRCALWMHVKTTFLRIVRGGAVFRGFSWEGDTISELEPLWSFMAFSCTFPMAASAQSAMEMRRTPASHIRTRAHTHTHENMNVGTWAHEQTKHFIWINRVLRRGECLGETPVDSCYSYISPVWHCVFLHPSLSKLGAFWSSKLRFLPSRGQNFCLRLAIPCCFDHLGFIAH